MAVVLLGLWLAIAFVGCAIGQSRGRPELGFFISLLVGPIGWVLVLFLPKSVEAEFEAQRRTAIETATVSAPPSAEANLARLDQLERLHALMQSGALTADEYNVEKSRLLADQPASTPHYTQEAARPPGWYPDPDAPQKMKCYWNGYKWRGRRKYHFWESA